MSKEDKFDLLTIMYFLASLILASQGEDFYAYIVAIFGMWCFLIANGSMIKKMIIKLFTSNKK